MDLELDGQIALVTGASRGLGAAIARALADEGAHVVAAARSPIDVTDERITAATVDVSDVARLPALVDTVLERHGRIDILVNNAGIAPAGAFATQDQAVWRRVLDVNVLAPMALAQAAGRHFLAQGSGRIVNVASTTGVRGKPQLVAYSASKAALVRMTEALAAEWAPHGIQVNAIAPGAFATDAQRAVTGDPDLLRRRVRRIPAGRMAEPREIVELACLLCSPRASFVNGAVFVIDGGESGKL